MEMYEIQQEIYRRRWLLEDEKLSRNYSRSHRPVRNRPFFGANQRTLMEPSFHKNFRDFHQELGEKIQQENRGLYKYAFAFGKRKNPRRRSGNEDKKEKKIFLACKRIQSRVQVLWTCWQKKHGKLPILKPPDKTKMLFTDACQKEEWQEDKVCLRQTSTLQNNTQ